MAHGQRKQNVTLLDELMDAPWPLIVVLGVVMLIGLEWILPSLAPDNVILNSIIQSVSAIAWVLFGLFFLIGAVFYAAAVSSKSHRPTQKAGRSDTGSRSASKRHRPVAPTTAPQVVEETAVTGNLAVEPTPAVEIAGPEQARDIHDAWDEHVAEMEAKPTAWSLDVIRDIEWKRFEDLCQKFYETSGIRSESTALGPDGGMDILLYQDDTGKPTAIVQCTAWGDCLVGVRPVRELLGAMTHEKIGKAFFLSSGHFADEAKVVASSNRITLINGEMLLMMLKRLPEAARNSLLEFATEGDYKTPTCPNCGIKMKRLSGKSGRPDFWACHNYPRCDQKFRIGQESPQQAQNC